MKDLLTPTYMFASYRDVTPAFLLEKGIRGLLLDIDNTLAPYEQAEPDDHIRAWVRSMQESGIRIALVSNNVVVYNNKQNKRKPLAHFTSGFLQNLRKNGVSEEIINKIDSAHISTFDSFGTASVFAP